VRAPDDASEVVGRAGGVLRLDLEHDDVPLSVEVREHAVDELGHAAERVVGHHLAVDGGARNEHGPETCGVLIFRRRAHAAAGLVEVREGEGERSVVARGEGESALDGDLVPRQVEKFEAARLLLRRANEEPGARYVPVE